MTLTEWEFTIWHAVKKLRADHPGEQPTVDQVGDLVTSSLQAMGVAREARAELCQITGAECPSGMSDPEQCIGVLHVAIMKALRFEPPEDQRCCCTHQADVRVPAELTMEAWLQ